MSPDQCREAGIILKWTRGDLADAAGVTLWLIFNTCDPDAGHKSLILLNRGVDFAKMSCHVNTDLI